MSDFLRKHKAEKIILRTVGMCGLHCVDKVESGLRSLEGVLSATADFEKNAVKIEYDPRKVTIEDLKRMILNVGYKVL
jgi:copper chaperone